MPTLAALALPAILPLEEPGGVLGETLTGVLTIAVWVALWVPLERVLFTRWEAADRLRTLGRLERMTLEVVGPLPASASAADGPGVRRAS